MTISKELSAIAICLIYKILLIINTQLSLKHIIEKYTLKWNRIQEHLQSEKEPEENKSSNIARK